MEKQFTLETRLSLDDEAKKYLNEYITFVTTNFNHPTIL